MTSILKKLLIVSIFLPSIASAYYSLGKPNGFVNDYARLLTQDQISSIENKISTFEKNTGSEIAVVTIDSLGGDTVENFAEELFKEWGIGKKGADNGVLLLVAFKDHKMRIEVGYGLEGALTDGEASSIIRNTLTPAFKQNDFGGGIEKAVDQMIEATASESFSLDSKNTAPAFVIRIFDFVFGNLLYFLFIPLWMASILGRSKSWWAGGVLGAIVGLFLSIFFGYFIIVILIVVGLVFDYIVSKTYKNSVASGNRVPWWIGGGGRGGGFGGGGFSSGGGFGGGSSGGRGRGGTSR
jgi:uncharacterized protein